MFRRKLMALTVFGALSVAGLGAASRAEAHCGGGYYGGYGAYYGPTYSAGYYPGYAVAYPAPYPYVTNYGPYGYPRYHHHHHDGVVVSFGF